MKLLTLLLLSLVILVAEAKSAPQMAASLALADAEKLSELEKSGFAWTDLVASSAMKPIIAELKNEVAAHAKTKDAGEPFDTQFFENAHTQFVLVGVVNRMDRGYRTGNLCGETRLIYRLAYDVVDNGKAVRSRLPVTFNLVFNGGLSDNVDHCRELARAWLAMSSKSTVSDWISSGPLSKKFFRANRLHALEFNIQASRLGSEHSAGFGGFAQYLLRVYKWTGREFEESTLENQIDRAAIVADKGLLKELKEWILQPENLKALDAGTVVFPEKFLAKKAYSVAPGGLARSQNRPFYGLFKAEDFKGVSFNDLEQIKSVNGLTRRLNDVTCTGCHQTRAIGGFHFAGLDPMGKYPGNSVFLPGSPHFTGDLARRLSVLQAVAKGDAEVDYSRGFSARPQARRSQSLEGTGLVNGWGAHCATGNDPSFKGWTCGEGLVCTKMVDVTDDSGMGICLAPKLEVGGACEFGTTKNISFGVDQFTRTSSRKIKGLDPKKAMCSPQSQDKGTKTGGFFGGNVRTLSCQDGPGEPGLPPEAACGPLPSARPGFNACVGKKNFDDCLKEFSIGVGLRACDVKNPCRDDYICAESYTPGKGICAPPYFLFQFRVDGHPKGNL